MEVEKADICGARAVVQASSGARAGARRWRVRILVWARHFTLLFPLLFFVLLPPTDYDPS